MEEVKTETIKTDDYSFEYAKYVMKTKGNVEELMKSEERYVNEWSSICDKDFEIMDKKVIPFEKRKKMILPYRFQKFLEYIKEGDAVLDIGCGDGYFLYEVIQKKATGFGCDISQKAIDKAIVNVPTAEFKQSRGEKLDYPPEIMDVIIMSQVIEHVRTPIKILKEAWRVLKVGGVMLITTPVLKNLLDVLHSHFFNYYEDGVNEGLMELFDQLTTQYKIMEIPKLSEDKGKKEHVFFIVAKKEVKDNE